MRAHDDLRHEELAQLVGTSRETVNTAHAELAQRHWIKTGVNSLLPGNPSASSSVHVHDRPSSTRQLDGWTRRPAALSRLGTSPHGRHRQSTDAVSPARQRDGPSRLRTCRTSNPDKSRLSLHIERGRALQVAYPYGQGAPRTHHG
nr:MULTISPECIES: helix-turn-helix domain-containing protein [Mycobacterium]